MGNLVSGYIEERIETLEITLVEAVSVLIGYISCKWGIFIIELRGHYEYKTNHGRL